MSATLRGNLRLLLGMIRANRPTRVIVGLSHAHRFREDERTERR